MKRRSSVRSSAPSLVAALMGLILASVGCESILGIADHGVAPAADDGGAKVADSGRKVDGSSPPHLDSGRGEEHEDSGKDDAGQDSGRDATPGRAVASLQCAGDSGTCVSGEISSGGGFVPDDEAGPASLPDGATVTLTDDGFEFGGTTCDDAGTTCVTGGLTP